MRTLFYTDIRGLDSKLELALPLLSSARAERVNSLKKQDDKLRTAAAGLLLRAVLGITDDDSLCYTPLGKPYLPTASAQFNLSHGGNLAVLAVSENPVGADTEPLWRTANPDVLSRILTKQEFSCLDTSEIFTFPALWTRKEAVMKACGEGLSLHASSFEVLKDTCEIAEKTYQLSTCFIYDHAISVAEEADTSRGEFPLQELPIDKLL